MGPLCAIVLLCLVSLGTSAPLACEDLLRPLDQLGPHHLEGRWAMVAGSYSHLPFMERLRKTDSGTIHFSRKINETNISWRRAIRVDDECRYISYNISLEGSSFNHGNVTTTVTHTSCHDCLLMSCDVESGTQQHLFLFSKRRQLEEREMEEFKAQVKCLNMSPPAVMDPTKELCPEETVNSSN